MPADARAACDHDHVAALPHRCVAAAPSNQAHAAAAQNLRFVRRLMDKQRMHHLAQRHRLQYPTAQYTPGRYSAANDVRQPQPVPDRPFGQAPAFGMGAGQAGAGRLGGVGWLPAERAFDRGDASGKDRGERTEVWPSSGRPQLLRATDHKGYSWSVRDEMDRAQADRERAARKQRRLEEEAEAREVERDTSATA